MFESHPTDRVVGRIQVPGDKSISHRALILGAIAEGTTRIDGLLESRDCMATLKALASMGVRFSREDSRVLVHGVGLQGLRAPVSALDLGNSGTAMRLLSGLLAGQVFSTELVGDDSLSRRPMGRVAEPLNQMGAAIGTRNGCPPVSVGGGRTLQGIRYRMPVASAQVKSAILLAGLYAQGATAIIEPVITRDHTERMLATFGVEMDLIGRGITLHGPATLTGCELAVPGDLSSAAFLIVAACLRADPGVLINNVGVNSTRLGVLQVLREMGANIELLNMRQAGNEPVADLHIRRSKLHGIDIGADLVAQTIDEFPAVFVAAAAAEGRTELSGAAELRHKESDRIAVMAAGLRNLGINVREKDDGAIIVGGPIHGGEINTGGDHRVAMAFAVAGCASDGVVRVHDTDNVATSFPRFVELAQSIGIRVAEMEVTGAPASDV